MIVLLGGEEKTGKTTFALTFPKPMTYFEFDIGGFDRAASRFSATELSGITGLKFSPTVHMLLLKDKTKIGTLKIVGEKERWQNFILAYNNACTSADCQTIVLDTWFQVYELVRQAYLQLLQEAQLDEAGNLKKTETKFRETLQQVEYTQPYSKLRSLIFYAKASGKNLVLTTYDADEYKPQISDDGKIRDVRTGKKIMAGWKETEKHADLALWTFLDGTSPSARITLPGIAKLDQVGEVLPKNSYDCLMKVLSL